MHTEEITKMVEQFRQEEKGGSQLNWWESISQHGEPWGCIHCTNNMWEQRKLVLPKFMRDKKTHDDNDESYEMLWQLRDYETFDDKDAHWKSKWWKPRLF